MVFICFLKVKNIQQENCPNTKTILEIIMVVILFIFSTNICFNSAHIHVSQNTLFHWDFVSSTYTPLSHTLKRSSAAATREAAK